MTTLLDLPDEVLGRIVFFLFWPHQGGSLVDGTSPSCLRGPSDASVALAQACRRLQAPILPLLWGHVALQQVWELGRLQGKLADVPSRARLIRSFAWRYKWAACDPHNGLLTKWDEMYDEGGPDLSDVPGKRTREAIEATALDICFAPRFGPDFLWHSIKGGERHLVERRSGSEHFNTGWVDGVLLSMADVENALGACLAKMTELAAFMCGFQDSAIPGAAVDALRRIETLEDFFWDPCQAFFGNYGPRGPDEAPIWKALGGSCPRRLTMHLASDPWAEAATHPVDGYVDAAIKTIEAATWPEVRLTHLELPGCMTDAPFAHPDLLRSWVRLEVVVVGKGRVASKERPLLRAVAALRPSLIALRSLLNRSLEPGDVAAHLVDCAVDGVILPEGACLLHDDESPLAAFSQWLTLPLFEPARRAMCDAFHQEVRAPSCAATAGCDVSYRDTRLRSIPHHHCGPTETKMRSIVSLDAQGRPRHSDAPIWRKDCPGARVELDRFRFVQDDGVRGEPWDGPTFLDVFEESSYDTDSREILLDIASDFASGINAERRDWHYQHQGFERAYYR